MKKQIWLIGVILASLLVWLVRAEDAKQTNTKPDDAKINGLITQLGDDDWETREKAQKTLEDWPIDKHPEIEPSLDEASKSDAPEIRSRAVKILKTLKVKKRIKFSDSFLTVFPDMYSNLGSVDSCVSKFELMENVAANESVQYKIAAEDISVLISEILADGGNGLSAEQKSELIRISKDRFWGPITSTAPSIMKLLNDENGQVRYDVIYALGVFGYKKALPEIRKLLTDEEQFIRLGAAQSLGNMDDKDFLPEIRKLLGDSKHLVRVQAIYTLSKLGDKASVNEIRKFLDGEDGRIRAAAVAALAELGDEELLPKAPELLKDKESEVRCAVIEMLGKSGGKKQTAQIREMLKDTDCSVCITAIEALSKLVDTSSIPEIRKMIKSQDDTVRINAIIGLIKLGDRESITEIHSLIADEDESVRINAILECGKSGNKDVITELVKHLDDKDATKQGVVSIALVELGAKDKVKKGVIEHVIKISRIQSCVSEWGSRNRAKRALKELGVNENEIK
ncbi:MAG: HEAT repeat domain-containing protein [Planctomycetes bacterium]|nr:HEAT repeat domain-containing protein [Planctomycetota bacterium]